MRRTMPSGPGAAETVMRSTSVLSRSPAFVRSMADASGRTFTASTAWALDKPIRRAMTIATGLAAREKRKLEPPLPLAFSGRPDGGSAGRHEWADFTPISRLPLALLGLGRVIFAAM